MDHGLVIGLTQSHHVKIRLNMLLVILVMASADPAVFAFASGLGHKLRIGAKLRYRRFQLLVLALFFNDPE